MSEREQAPPKGSALRGRLVEGVRLIFIAMLGTGGFLLGGTVATESTGRALAFIFLGRGVRLRGGRRRRAPHAPRGQRHGTRAPAQARSAAGRRHRGPGGRPRRRGSADAAAAAGAGRRGMAGDRVHLPRVRLARLPARRGEARGHLRTGRDEAASVGRRARRPPRAGHERADRRPGRRSGGDRVRQRHGPAARRGAARAAGDQRLVGPTTPRSRPPRSRRAGRASEGPDRRSSSWSRRPACWMWMPPWCAWRANGAPR